jgi:hypothetical protein
MVMLVKSLFRPLLVPAMLLLPAAAQAQLFWQPPDLTSQPMTGAEPESGVNLPGASPAELNAGLLWNLRAALNVAALQCDFEPTLLTTSNYNAMLAHHRVELGSAFKSSSTNMAPAPIRPFRRCRRSAISARPPDR